MKKLMFVSGSLLITTLAFGQKIQEKDLPAPVKTAFQKLYPNAQEVKWEKEDGKYEADFDLNKVDNSVLIDAQGTIVETEIEIELNQLPKGVLDYVAANYKGQNVKEAAKITDAAGNITFEAEIKDKDLIFDNGGKFLKEMKD